MKECYKNNPALRSIRGVTVESCNSPVLDRSFINNVKRGTRCFANRKCDSVGIILVIRERENAPFLIESCRER
ncbi:hypothetical protein TNIN_61021 [Trichonephila inaurata madagascariensis]|uniref:Uncharacterized protein n=1 Tax=Trichonephila inaurata madagascariensis TaxID=2747483 RepID=A0A8X6YP83_9ARAC|nr:hypothetical protein TNIN_61021 [Trichonephila inaurata madagascariensis]